MHSVNFFLYNRKKKPKQNKTNKNPGQTFTVNYVCSILSQRMILYIPAQIFTSTRSAMPYYNSCLCIKNILPLLMPLFKWDWNSTLWPIVIIKGPVNFFSLQEWHDCYGVLTKMQMKVSNYLILTEKFIEFN